MIDNTELQRLMRIRRLGRQIADDLNRDQAFQTHGCTYGCEHGLPAGAPRYMTEPTSLDAFATSEDGVAVVAAPHSGNESQRFYEEAEEVTAGRRTPGGEF